GSAAGPAARSPAAPVAAAAGPELPPASRWASGPRDPPGAGAEAPDLPPGGRAPAAPPLGAATALRGPGAGECRSKSDQPQPTHVIWGWTQGLVQYRDFFDNHAPLFHRLWAPVLAALGESVRALFWLRLTMLPLYLASLALTYAIGRRLLSRRAA